MIYYTSDLHFEPEFLATKVVACCKGKRKSHKNFIWIYHEKDSLI